MSAHDVNFIQGTSCEDVFPPTLFVGALDAFDMDVAILDENGDILFVNQAWRTLASTNSKGRQEPGVGSNYFQIIDFGIPEDRETHWQSIAGVRAVLSGQQDSFQLEFQAQSRWFLLNARRFNAGDTMRVLVTHEDISQRKVAEQRLVNKQEKLRTIYHSVSDAILLFDSGGLFDCNSRAITMFGASCMNELLGMRLWDFAPALQPNGNVSFHELAVYLERVKTGVEVRFQFVLRHMDGSIFPVEIQLGSLMYNNERVVQATVHDFTERKQVEQRLQEMNRQLQIDLDARSLAEKKFRETTAYLDVYRKIVDHHAIVAETDTKGTILSVNDAFCRISGYSREELIGQNHRLLNSGLHPTTMWREMYRTVAKGGCWHGEICNRAKNGSLYWVDTRIAPLHDESGKLRGYFAIRTDITSLKLAQYQAEAASRSKSEFLANMSHEIRTPMTAILGYADLLSEIEGCTHCDASSRASSAIETIQRNGEHLLAIINDILDISKIEAEKMTIESVPVDLRALCNDVLKTMQVKSQAKGLKLTANLLSPIPKIIETDPTRLRQILVNLIGNAIKFTECGSVTLNVRADEADAQSLLLDVADTGIGMSPEQVSKLFQAFEQGDTSMTRRFGGTGLGLRISKRLAEMLGGDITVKCQPGLGCVFTVRITTGNTQGQEPITSLATETADKDVCAPASGKALAPLPERATAGAQSQRAALAGVRILLAEDGPDNQKLISHHLRKAGARVLLVDNGLRAVQAMTTTGEVGAPLTDPCPFDLVLMDMQMPEMDGYEATRVLRSKGASLPILALTAHAMAADLQQCLDAGCDRRLTKPINRQELIDVCSEHAPVAESQP